MTDSWTQSYAPTERWYSPEGRIRRMTWATRVFGGGFVMVLFVAVCSVLGRSAGGGGRDFLMIPAVLGALAFAVFRFIQDVKRLHDMGRSGWWMICAFIPLFNLIYLCFILFADGEPFTNAYGPDPKGRGQENDQEALADVFR